jgi:hypothetical protein
MQKTIKERMSALGVYTNTKWQVTKGCESYNQLNIYLNKNKHSLWIRTKNTNQQPRIQNPCKIDMPKPSIDAALRHDPINKIAGQHDEARMEGKEAARRGQLQLDLRKIERRNRSRTQNARAGRESLSRMNFGEPVQRPPGSRETAAELDGTGPRRPNPEPQQRSAHRIESPSQSSTKRAES